jgi:hypothetical protein
MGVQIMFILEEEDHTVQGTYFLADRKDEERAFLTFSLLNV